MSETVDRCDRANSFLINLLSDLESYDIIKGLSTWTFLQISFNIIIIVIEIN